MTPNGGGAAGLGRARAWVATPAGALLLLIVATGALRLAFAAAVGLGVDESYMVAAGRLWQLSYFDHPPLSWWLAWAAAHLLGTESRVAVRLPFIALFAVSTLLMYRATTLLFGRRAGLGAAAILNAAPVLGVTSASWVLPDGPLIAALLAALRCFLRALSAEGRAAWVWWLAAGAAGGLALLSKYSAALSLLGAVLYLVTEPAGRRWLLRPHPYAAGAVALLLFLPALLWNAWHGWVSFDFQAGRAGGDFSPLGPLAAIGGAALYFLPWIWLLLVVCAAGALRAGPRHPARWLCLCLAAPPIVVFTADAAWSHILFHWTAPGYLMLVPLAGDWIARRWQRQRGLRGAAAATAIIVLAGAGLVIGAVRFGWGGSAVAERFHGDDPTMALVDWTELRSELARRGFVDRPGLAVAAVRWHEAGKIDYALGGRVPVLCLGEDPRQYGVGAPLARFAGFDVLIIAPRYSAAGIAARFGGLFRSLEPLPPIALSHAGHRALLLPLYLGRDLRPLPSAARP